MHGPYTETGVRVGAWERRERKRQRGERKEGREEGGLCVLVGLAVDV